MAIVLPLTTLTSNVPVKICCVLLQNLSVLQEAVACLPVVRWIWWCGVCAEPSVQREPQFGQVQIIGTNSCWVSLAIFVLHGILLAVDWSKSKLNSAFWDPCSFLELSFSLFPICRTLSSIAWLQSAVAQLLYSGWVNLAQFFKDSSRSNKGKWMGGADGFEGLGKVVQTSGNYRV